MTWRKLLVAAAVLGGGLMLSQCGGQSAAVRYRVIATAEIDGQRVEGSTVMEVNYRRVKHSLIGAGGGTTLHGEALILDLKGRGTVFLLPVRHHNKTEVMEIYEHGILLTFGVRNSIGRLADEDFARLRQAKGRRPLSFAPLNPPLRLPAFVAFRDEKVPNTIYEVDPQRMDSSFPGVRFISLDIEITDAPVTKVLKQRLPWLASSTQLFDRDPPGSSGHLKTGRSGTRLRTIVSLETGADNAFSRCWRSTLTRAATMRRLGPRGTPQTPYKENLPVPITIDPF